MARRDDDRTLLRRRQHPLTLEPCSANLPMEHPAPATSLLCRPDGLTVAAQPRRASQQVRLNALKHGLHSDPLVQGPTCPRPNCWRTGLDRAPDSPAKFEKMLSCFGVLISQAKQGAGKIWHTCRGERRMRVGWKRAIEVGAAPCDLDHRPSPETSVARRDSEG
jgi:hypothetical protein